MSVAPLPTAVPGFRPVAVSVGAATVAVVIVTWNRKGAVDVVLGALARQSFGAIRLHVAVVDNGSTDGTAGHLAERWLPERVITNSTTRAEEPAFLVGDRRGENTGGFASLSVIANAHNLGGCGGFNTGLAWAATLAPEPEFVWLVDDDVDLPEDALQRLTATARADPRVGLVGSRTVDFADRKTTIETTIYFDYQKGRMAPEPPAGHHLRESHLAWVKETGGTRGLREFSGVREVDVLSACSLLARWSAVKRVGYWDRRYFIYCDDADWCLRFAKAGYRVLLDLDAVVYHTYWLAKLTPARAYYAERNLAWLSEKVLDESALRRAMSHRLGGLLLDSRKAATHCRLFHAEILRRTVDDVARNRGGKLDEEGPKPEPVMAALDRAGALRADAEVLVMCSAPDSVRWADEFRTRVSHGLLDAGRPADQPRWTYLLGPSAGDPTGGLVAQPSRVRFERNRKSKWGAQKAYFRTPPAAVIVFDQSNEFPLVRSRWNIHVDRRRPELAQAERDGLGLRLRFLARWALTALRCGWYCWRVRPRVQEGLYG